MKQVSESQKCCETSHKDEISNTFFFTSSVEDMDRFYRALVGVMKNPGLAYGVAQSLIKEGIFTITATPIGPNLCLMEESVEGYMDLLFKDTSLWKDVWFKEIRKWKSSDVECYRATRISLYGIPFFVRNSRFIDVLLSDIGTLINPDSLQANHDRYNVIRLIVFTNLLSSINRRIRACVDGEFFNILVVEKASVSPDTNSSFKGSEYSLDRSANEEVESEQEFESGTTEG